MDIRTFFVQKIDSSGNFLWAQSFGGSDTNNHEAKGLIIASDASGNLYTAGSFLGTVDFDPGVATFNLTSNGLYGLFIQKMDSSGNFLWAESIRPGVFCRPLSMTTDATESVYTLGSFSGTIDFDPGVGIFNLTAQDGFGDFFVRKMSPSNTTFLIEQTNSLVNLYPNPTSDFVTINFANKSKGQVIVLDLLGKNCAE